MRPMLFTAIAASALVASVAIAQPAPPPGPPPGGPGGPGGPPPRGMEGMEEHGGWMHGRRPMPPPPTKAAFFSFRHGEDVVTVKCADDEPTKACTDAVATLMAAIRPVAK